MHLLYGFVFSLFSGALAQLKIHDAAFEPEYVLEAIAVPIKVNCETRYSVTFNGTSPGPALRLKEGHTTWIRVYNRMSDQNVTVHWHGLSQRTAPFSDGTPLVSQWPIPPNQYFDYEIRPERGDAGTYFYHSHVGFQLSTAHGPLIVDDATPPPYQYDDEIVLTMGDYYQEDDHTIETGLLADPFRWSGEPQAIVIQGCSGKSDFANATDSTCAPYIIEVDPDKVYRLRIIGATVLSLVQIGIEDHPALEVIEADGSYTEGTAIDYIQVASGQRFSYLLKTKSGEDLLKGGKSQFWIRYESRDRPQSITGYALLTYRSQPKPLPSALPGSPPVKLPQSTSDYLEFALQPMSKATRDSFPRLSEVTRTVTIQVNQQLTSGQFINGTPDGSLEWEENGFSWKQNVQADLKNVPYLIEVYKSGKTPNYTLALQHGGFDPTSRTFLAQVGEVLDIVWQNNNGATGSFDFHPMHIHGEHAWDLGSGNGTYNASENERHFEDFIPAKRDTTVLYRYTQKGVPHTTAGWRAWRIRVTEDNVGAWMMHCHIAQHSVMGMNTVWMFGDAASILRKFPTVPYIQGYLDYGGSAYGNYTQGPSVYHFFNDSNVSNYN